MPSGKKKLKSWADNGYRGAIPDSLLAAHVLQVNLQRHAREAERKRCGLAVKPSIMLLVYATPTANAAVVFELPQW